MKQIRVLAGLLVLLLLLTGCESKPEEPIGPTNAPTPQKQMETITIYTVNPDTLTLVPVSVKKEEEEITAQYITELVLSNLHEYDIAEPKLDQKGKKLYVSFMSEIKDCDKKVERLLLDCFANSLLDNIEACHDVVFQVNDKPYKSKNFKFKRDEVYKSR